MNDLVVSCATSIESMRCSSRVVPSVTDTSAWVWPRVNSAERIDDLREIVDEYFMTRSASASIWWKFLASRRSSRIRAHASSSAC
jgi:hypothetical protein